ncbi:MAG TPA: DUF427 domain-containing protein [Candidatus Saccharimonadales bacterium]|nr:DUF427 domain-containing protein [Candidatus Saccharimonadales bacterium]
MKAVMNGVTIAEADKDELIFIERNWYFPPKSVKVELRKSDTPYTCPWKGVCQYFDVKGQGEAWTHDAAWSYPEPKPSAIEIVKKDFSNYLAFDPQQVSIEE